MLVAVGPDDDVGYDGPLIGSSVRWASLLGDSVRSAALHALRLFSILLSSFGVLGHHDKERCRTGGALGHGTGPWDDVTGVVKRAIVFDDFSENFVDIDMNARRQAVDEWMASRRETQSMYWEQPTDAYRSYSTYRSQLRSQQQTIHDA